MGGVDQNETTRTPQPFRVGPYRFKRADRPNEFRQIHALNHAIFVSEIGQHADDGSGRLVDKYHARNRYFIAQRGTRVVGLVAVHDEPPFSVTRRLPNPADSTPLGPRPLEVRLLAIAPDTRRQTVFAGLGRCVITAGLCGGYAHLVISGIVARQALYARLGFVALGPPIAEGAAAFVPMVLNLGSLAVRLREDLRRFERRVATE